MDRLLNLEVLEQTILRPDTMSRLRIGHVLSVSNDGEVLVSYPDNTRGPLSAKLLLSSASDVEQLTANSPVLLAFLESEHAAPVVLGVLADKIPVRPVELLSVLPSLPCSEIIVDGKGITLEGQKEIVIRCGKGSIVLKRDGKITIKGTNIVSRSSGRNKLRGASIELN